MSQENGNTCARCGVPIKVGEDLCKVCAADATSRRSIVPCIACGAANSSSAKTCEACGAPLKTPATREPDESDLSRMSGTRIRGRQAELQVLMDCFDVCLENGRVGGSLVMGDAGMGVSAVLDAFGERLTGRIPSSRIFHIHCRKDDDLFGPIRGAFRQRLQAAEEADPMATRLRLTNLVGSVLGASSAALVTETAHLLGYLANMPFPNSPVLQALEPDPDLLLRRIREAVIRFVQADAADGPMALIIDGFHRASQESRDFHMDIFTSLGDVSVMVVVGGTREIKDITDNPAVVCVELEPLDDDVMRSLFGDFMPLLEDPADDLVEAVVSRASGNPGSLKQLCALLTETGVVDTTTKPWTADVSKLTMADIPVNIMDAFKARLERLDPRDRAVLKYAAVIGDVFWDEAVVALTRQRFRLKDDITAAQIWADDSDGLAVSSSLGRLVERQFIVELPDRDIPGAMKYAFAKSGVRDEILGAIEEKERRGLHYLAAQWLAHVTAQEGPLFARDQAEQWEESGEKHRAALAYFEAARYARSRYLNQKCIMLFQKGLELADERDRVVIADTLHDLGSVQELLGQYEAAELYYTEMLKHAWILVHRGKAGAALNKIGRLYRSRGDSAAARAFLDRGMSLFKAAGDEKGVAACLGDLGELARRQGSYDRAFKQVSQALELQRKMDNQRSVAVCLHSLGHIEAGRASYAQAERYLEEALDIRRSLEDKGGMAHTLSALAIVLFSRGDLDRAIARWEAAQNLAEEVGDRRMLAIVQNNLGEAFRDQGKLEESMRHFKACEAVVTTLDDRLLHSEVSRNIGILSRKMGDLDSSRLQLERSLMLAREVGAKELEGLALRALGELCAETMWDTSNVDSEDEAVTYYEQSLKIFEAIGSDYEIARTLHAFGNRLLERGDVDGGKGRLEKAREIFERIESKTGDKIGRTIKEISDQTGSTAAQARNQAKKKSLIETLKPKKKPGPGNGIPDMTEDLESNED